MFLYLSFGEHMNAFLLDTNLGVELLDLKCVNV